MPAFRIRMSRRGSARLNVDAAEAMDAKDVRSTGRKTISQADGRDVRMEDMAAWALEGVRAAR
jgi:hypothetical protein